MIYKLMRKLAKPLEDAAIDTATDITTKTAKKTADKSVEAGVDSFFKGLDYAAKRTRAKTEDVGAFALYCLKGGLLTEFKISAQRMQKTSKDIRKTRRSKLKPPARKK
ncbi:MAG: hypothetical protein HND56_10785 [Pseudomonadota bacterium]|jgi:hypothetical protein|nr:hypothetical protein [Pseudomonadota bacterium]QKK06140.1 MAG: hypothetical protein HND56_10785 [Pseudomonadota bacterium]|tara:strand:- start:160 stop:483 length:324 start_codon:yes stop_codon:yes gene_type:complete